MKFFDNKSFVSYYTIILLIIEVIICIIVIPNNIIPFYVLSIVFPILLVVGNIFGSKIVKRIKEQ